MQLDIYLAQDPVLALIMNNTYSQNSNKIKDFSIKITKILK